MPRSRDEKVLRREILLALGHEPDVLVMVNEANVYTQLLDLVKDRTEAIRRILPEERFGLGIGSPDLVLVVGGRFLGLELKRAGGEGKRAGRVSEAQEQWARAALRAGAVVSVVHSVEEARLAVEAMRGAR